MVSSYNLVIPYGSEAESLEVAVSQLPIKKVIAVIPRESDARAMRAVKQFLSKRGIPIEIRAVSDEAPDGVFLALSKIKSKLKGGNLLVGVSTGTLHSHIMLCAAMATGVTAFGVYEGKVVFLPISCSISHGR